MKWKRFLGTLCCHKAVFLRGVTSTLNSFYATKRQPLLFFNEKCGLGLWFVRACPGRSNWSVQHARQRSRKAERESKSAVGNKQVPTTLGCQAPRGGSACSRTTFPKRGWWCSVSGHGSHALDHWTAKKIEIRESSMATAAHQCAAALRSLRQSRPVPSAAEGLDQLHLTAMHCSAKIPHFSE